MKSSILAIACIFQTTARILQLNYKIANYRRLIISVGTAAHTLVILLFA
jgi:hypothetical protein